MSVEKAIDVFCDKCGNWVHADMNCTAKKARRIARDFNGYRVVKGQDLCPDCQPKEGE